MFRHWSVFFSGTTTTLIFWVITPLLGTIFTENRLVHTVNSNSKTVKSLVPGTSNAIKLDVSVIADAYGVTWLGQDLPGFVTATGAVAPFKLDSSHQKGDLNTSWTTATDFYTTELNCVPARIAQRETSGLIFDNGRGCQTNTISPLSASGYNAFYIGYYSDPHVDWALQSPLCPSNTSHTFLAIWADMNDSTFNNVTALFCEPTYSVQPVEATIITSNQSVIRVTPLGSSMALSPELFNASDFEYLLGAGISSVTARADVPQTNTLDQWPRLKKMDVCWPVSNMVGFALGLSRLPPDDYFDPIVLASSFQAVHQLLFAMAVPKLVSSNLSATNLRQGSQKTEVKAIVIIPELTIVIEVILGLVAVFILALLMISSTRKSQLCGDPASLSDLIELAKLLPSASTLDISRQERHSYPNRLKLEAGRLHYVCEAPKEKSACVAVSPQPRRSPSSQNRLLANGQHQKLIRPLEMTLPIAATFLASLCIAIVVLILVYSKMASSNGLRLPSRNQAVNQLVLNYIPIVFATFLEPFWTLLNRLLCILQPFEALRQGQGKPSQSLDVKYTALPPQLVFWRALRARHLVLVAVCFIGLSANFLAVSLGALFENNLIQLHSTSRFRSVFAPMLNQSISSNEVEENPNPYREHFYTARSNISVGTALPAWNTPHAFLVPFDVDTNQDTLAYTASTQGIALKVGCEQLNSTFSAATTSSYNMTEAPDPLNIDSDGELILTQTNHDGTKVACMTQNFGGSSVSDNVNGTYAAEILSTMLPSSPNPTMMEQEVCAKLFVTAFLRANLTIAQTTPGEPDGSISRYRVLQALYLGCEASLEVAPFDATVNREGHVKEFTQTGPFDATSSRLLHLGNTSSFYNAINGIMWFGQRGNEEVSWHSDLIADTWLPYLIKIYTQSTAFLDPSLPPPSASSIGPVIEDLTGRLFAIMLGLNADRLLLPAPSGSTIPGATITSTTRVFMSKPMFIVSVVLLILNVLVAILYYARRPQKMLTSMPNTIASVLDMIEGSGLVGENAHGRSREEWRIGYGRYVGTDGKPHVGIERRPFVVPWTGK
ncbi:MAG: hypothetical protein Q9201_006364 [Fulgogasparrea decipioides]